MFVVSAVPCLNSFTLFCVYKYIPVILPEANNLFLLRHHYFSSVVMPTWISYVAGPVNLRWKWRQCFPPKCWNIWSLHSVENQRQLQFELSLQHMKYFVCWKCFSDIKLVYWCLVLSVVWIPLHYFLFINTYLFLSFSKVWHLQEHGPVLMNLTGLK
jgi:hypothetical protein